MALSATTVFEAQTGGSDTLNGGCFDPGQTAGMFADGAATAANTSAPVFTSASYAFLAGDVGAWVYVASGTNWTAGWYKIASVAGGAATLDAAVGHAVLSTHTLTTAAGCATVASPTAATWSIDYSQQAAAQFAYTDLASGGAGLTVSSAAKPFAKQQVGNSIVVTGGTNFTAGHYVIASVAAGVATVVGAANITTGVGASGTGGQGGAFASLGSAAGFMVTGNRLCVLAGVYIISSTTANVSGGRIALSGATIAVVAYSAVRNDGAALATMQVAASGVTAITVITLSGANSSMEGILVDGQSKATITGITLAANGDAAINCRATGCVNGINGSSVNLFFYRCCSYSNSGIGIVSSSSFMMHDCTANANTGAGISTTGSLVGGTIAYCFSTGNGGAGISIANTGSCLMVNCTSDGNAGNGVTLASAAHTVINHLSTNSSAGFGYSGGATHRFINCSGYNNFSGDQSGGVYTGFTALSADPYTNKAGGNYSLNATAGGGAANRATGLPGAFPGLPSTTGYLDRGAAQHQDSGGAGGSVHGPIVAQGPSYI